MKGLVGGPLLVGRLGPGPPGPPLNPSLLKPTLHANDATCRYSPMAGYVQYDCWNFLRFTWAFRGFQTWYFCLTTHYDINDFITTNKIRRKNTRNKLRLK